MQINNAVKTLVFFLKSNPVFYRAQIVSNMELTGWLSAAKYSLFHKLDGVQDVPEKEEERADKYSEQTQVHKEKKNQKKHDYYDSLAESYLAGGM